MQSESEIKQLIVIVKKVSDNVTGYVGNSVPYLIYNYVAWLGIARGEEMYNCNHSALTVK